MEYANADLQAGKMPAFLLVHLFRDSDWCSWFARDEHFPDSFDTAIQISLSGMPVVDDALGAKRAKDGGENVNRTLYVPADPEVEVIAGILFLPAVVDIEVDLITRVDAAQVKELPVTVDFNHIGLAIIFLKCAGNDQRDIFRSRYVVRLKQDSTHQLLYAAVIHVVIFQRLKVVKLHYPVPVKNPNPITVLDSLMGNEKCGNRLPHGGFRFRRIVENEA